jgi:hypothetical protein
MKPPISLIASALSTALLLAAAPLRGNDCEPATYPSTPLTGDYTSFDMNGGCGASGGLDVDLAFEPLFTREKMTATGCASSIATVRGGNVVDVASAPTDLGGWEAVQAADGSYWTISNDRHHPQTYVNLTGSGQIVTRPSGTGLLPVEIAADGRGHVFGVEEENSVGPDSAVIVSLDSQRTFVLAPDSFAGFEHGADGNLYVHVGDVKGNERMLQVSPNRIWSRNIAVWPKVAFASNGDIWRAQFNGLIHMDSNGRVLQRILGISSLPCTITNTAYLTPSRLVPQSNGMMWFILRGKLWRLSSDGRIQTGPLPGGIIDAFVGGTPGTVWFTVEESPGEILYRFH